MAFSMQPNVNKQLILILQLKTVVFSLILIRFIISKIYSSLIF